MLRGYTIKMLRVVILVVGIDYVDVLIEVVLPWGCVKSHPARYVDLF